MMRVRRGRRAVPRLALGSALALCMQGCDINRASSGGSQAMDDNPVQGASLDAGELTPVLLDSGTPVQTEPPVDASMPAEPVKDACDVLGLYAVQIEAQVSWEGSTLFGIVPIITPGDGKLDLVVLAEIDEHGMMRSANVRACGVTTPDFASSVGETYGVAFPNTLWEKLALRWDTPLTAPCHDKGCAVTSDKVIAQLGIDIPTTSSWPTSRDPIDVSTLRDDDGDGIPGVMVSCRGPKDPGGAMYTHPPTSYLLTDRISQISLGIRFAAQLQGKVDDCNHYSGDAPGVTIDTRCFGCILDTGARCNSDQVGFTDDNLPEWKVESAKFKAVRMPDGATCADARNAKF